MLGRITKEHWVLAQELPLLAVEVAGVEVLQIVGVAELSDEAAVFVGRVRRLIEPRLAVRIVLDIVGDVSVFVGHNVRRAKVIWMEIARRSRARCCPIDEGLVDRRN